MAAKSFSDQVTNWVNQSEVRLTAAFRQAVQDVSEEAQVPRGKGGNMPVDTGFLRSTGMAAINKLPVGESVNPDPDMEWEWDSAAGLVAIQQAQLGDTVYFGWTANYSIYMEDRYGFLRLAAQNWPQIVNKAAIKIERGANR